MYLERDKPSPEIIARMARGRPRTTPLPEPKNRIREWREHRNWSLQALAKRTVPRIPASTIQKHETTAGVDTRYLEIYAIALGVKTEELLPASNTLGDQERALLGLFKQLNPEQRSLFIRLGHSLAEPAEPYIPANNGTDGQ
jgi:transcriptional regulator with XRE-family HTH domain